MNNELLDYAIIAAGGKQLRVSPGDLVDIDAFFEGDVGSEVTFPALLVCKNNKAQIGAPTVPGCLVRGELVDLVSGPKITSVKYIPGNHRKKIGHRQHYTRVKINSIS
jgi:large subunit ribosomal protein L21